MQLNRQTDYALRVLMFLALKQNNSLSNLTEISEKFNIAKNHLTKIISKLAKLNFIITLRGHGGGIKIHTKTLDATLFDVMKHFEPTFKSIDCAGLLCPISGTCKLESILQEASDAYIGVLLKYKLKAIVAAPLHLQEIKTLLNRLDILRNHS